MDLRKYFFTFAFGLSIGIILCFSFNNSSPKPHISTTIEVEVQYPITLQNSTSVVTPTTPHNLSFSDKNKSDEESECSGQPNNVINAMTKEELVRASLAPKILKQPSDRAPRIAFLFLVRGPVLFAPLWEKFFKGNEGLFSIYVHSDPGYNVSLPENSVFYGRNIPSKEVQWGKVSMIEAERRLLAYALLDNFSNQRFILLSESCIPLFNFSTVYSYLTNSTQTFVESLDLDTPAGRGRYSVWMQPHITLRQWRKGAQWFEIDRDLAHEVVSDRTYFPVFQRLCKGSCYADEHYLPTFVNTKFGGRNSNRTLTWVDWSRGGAHPYTYRRQLVTIEFLEKLRGGKKCEYNGESTNVCHLFARKFHINALDRLLRFAPKVMHFNP